MWDTLARLEPKIVRVAHYWSARTGEPPDDIASEMRLAIIRRIQKDPSFSTQRDNYIVTYAAWRALDDLRAPRSVSLDALNVDVSPDSTDDTHTHLAELIAALSEDARALAVAILRAGDRVLKRNGTLNISALARHLAMPERTLHRRVQQLRAELKAAII